MLSQITISLYHLVKLIKFTFLHVTCVTCANTYFNVHILIKWYVEDGSKTLNMFYEYE